MEEIHQTFRVKNAPNIFKNPNQSCSDWPRVQIIQIRVLHLLQSAGKGDKFYFNSKEIVCRFSHKVTIPRLRHLVSLHSDDNNFHRSKRN
jgi:hypothetical protein